MRSLLAPVALFVYNRPVHTKKVIESLLKNILASETELFIFSDGPKINASSEQIQLITELREYIKNIRGFKSLKIIEREKNLGLAKSVIHGVTEIIKIHGKVIVLEDDIVVSPYFLDYMNEGLIIYESNEDVISISAYNYPIDNKGIPSTFFMRGADCQGWATWKRGWNLLETETEKLYNEIISKGLKYEFDIKGSYPYCEMLKRQIEGKVDSWAIRWYASAFLKNKYTLYPSVSLIFNIGFDNSGTHCGGVDNFNNKEWNDKFPVKIEKIDVIKNNKIVQARWESYLSRTYSRPNKSMFSVAYNLYKKIFRQFSKSN